MANSRGNQAQECKISEDPLKPAAASTRSIFPTTFLQEAHQCRNIGHDPLPTLGHFFYEFGGVLRLLASLWPSPTIWMLLIHETTTKLHQKEDWTNRHSRELSHSIVRGYRWWKQALHQLSDSFCTSKYQLPSFTTEDNQRVNERLATGGHFIPGRSLDLEGEVGGRRMLIIMSHDQTPLKTQGFSEAELFCVQVQSEVVRVKSLSSSSRAAPAGNIHGGLR